MKKLILLPLLLLCFNLPAQDLSKREVPSVILNNFQNIFPKASDVEWEKKGTEYKVEFEIGYWNNDQSAWFDSEGKLLRHKEEISKKDLPKNIYDQIQQDYKWYIISEIERITAEQKTTYQVELKSFTKEWKIIYDESGAILSKHKD